MPLDPPEFPGEDLLIDFMTDLPTTQRGNDMLMVVVDRFSKIAHLTPCKKSCTSEQVARLIVRDALRLHGVPKSVVSDRDPRFTSDMWQGFWKQLGTTLSMSAADLPQTDGQTEVVNRSINWMLRTVLESPGPAWDELASSLTTP
jgi:transposase InsO family protein